MIRLELLLADRFHLRVHEETRQKSVYFLSVARTGLKMPHDSAPHTGKVDLGAIVPWKLFVSQLERRLDQPVIDRTGLDGAYYVKLQYTTDDGHEEGIGIGRIDPTKPGMGPSLSTALREQLGLLVESGKGPVKVLVIDSVTLPGNN
jgi:uncharacterized protein (TIGR03435 family)